MDYFHPTTGYDYVLLGFAVAAAVPFIIANGVLFWHRKRSYFQAQGGVHLILGSSIAGLATLASVFVNNGHFSRDGPLRSCFVWIFCSQTPGVCTWIIFMVLRLRRMYEISHSIENSRWNYIFAALSLIPCVAFASVSYLGDFDRVKHGHHYCFLGTKWTIGLFVVSSSYWMLAVAAMYRMGNQQDPLVAKEFTRSFDYITIALIMIILFAFAVLTGATKSVAGRCFATFSVCCLSYSYFWIHFGWLVYLLLFRPEEEMDNFEREFTQPASRLYLTSSESAIWEAFTEGSEILGKYMDEIQNLQAQKVQLEGWIRELQDQQNHNQL